MNKKEKKRWRRQRRYVSKKNMRKVIIQCHKKTRKKWFMLNNFRSRNRSK